IAEKLQNLLAGTIRYLKNAISTTTSPENELVGETTGNITKIGPRSSFQHKEKNSVTVDDDDGDDEAEEETKEVSSQLDSDQQVQDEWELENDTDLEFTAKDLQE